jgi:hypothetical protein
LSISRERRFSGIHLAIHRFTGHLGVGSGSNGGQFRGIKGAILESGRRVTRAWIEYGFQKQDSRYSQELAHCEAPLMILRQI